MTEGTSLRDSGIYLFGPFRVEADEHLLLKNGTPVHIPEKAFDLLLALLRSAGRLRSREDLIEILWPNTIVQEANLTWNMNVLRRALGDERQNPRYIETVRGHGYRFIVPTKAVTTPQTPAVAVLPFENLSTDSANTYLTFGIQATILSKLSGIGELRVISRTSTEQYPSRPSDIGEVAAQLGVTAIVEGSVQKAGNQVLINVQLIDVRTADQIWGQSYTHSLADVFAVENDVATQVATALQTKLLPAEAVHLASSPTHNPQAYLLFLKANYYANQIIGSYRAKDPATTLAQAASLYREAIGYDPRFALAWARLSRLESYAYAREISRTTQTLANAEQTARRALTLAPELPQAHFAMGYVDYYGHGDHTAALVEFERARQNLPNDDEVAGAIALIYRRQGKWQQAIESLQHTATLDPRNSLWVYEIGVTLTALRRYAQAEQQFDLALALQPHDYDAAAFEVMNFLLMGKPLQQIQQTLAEIPRTSVQQGLIPTLQFEAAWLDHDPDAALSALADAPEWVSAPNAIGQEPVELLRAQAWTLRGDGTRARQAYTSACSILQNALLERPEDSRLWGFLGLAEAGLGQKSEAIRSGLKATSLTPISKDLLDGPSYLTTLAKIYARTDESDQALKLLRLLLSTPAGEFISVPLLRRDPVWDPLRKDSRLQALLKEYENKVPLPDLDVPGILSPVE